MYDYSTLPKKPMGAGVLFFNDQNELLIVKPTYKDGWTIPGGSVEAEESPRQGCLREIKEELGLEVSQLTFIALDYVTKMDNGRESLQFTFAGGTLSIEQINKITLPETELKEYRFVSTDEALNLLRHNLKKRLPHCLAAIKNNQAVYLENGEPI